MLIDYISPDRLPWVVVWLDWNFHAYGLSFLFCSALGVLHWWHSIPYHSFSGLGLALFVGACFWVVYCAARYGYAVG